MSSITFVDTVTHVPAAWANDVDALVYDIFGGAQTQVQAIENLGLGTLASQNAAQVQIAGGTLDNVTIGYTVAGVAKFQNVILLQEPFANQHAATKFYVDTRVDQALGALAAFQVTAPLTGNGSIGTPVTILSPNNASPTLGSRVLMKRLDSTYEAVPIASILPTSIANSVGTNSQSFNDGNTVPVWADPGTPVGQELSYSFLLLNSGTGLQLQVGSSLPLGAVFDAHDLQFDRVNATQTVTGSHSAILSGSSNTLRVPSSVILGGSQNNILLDVVGNIYCFIGVGTDCSVSGVQCSILSGDANSIISVSGDTSTYCSIISGSMNVISNCVESVIIAGSNNHIGGDGSVIVTGQSIDIEHNYVAVLNGSYVASRMSNCSVLASSFLGTATGTGVLRRSQALLFVMNAETMPASTEFLTTGWPSLDGEFVYNPPNNTMGVFELKLTALSKDSAIQFVWRAEGRVWRYSNIIYVNYTGDPVPSGYGISITTSAGAVEGLILNVNQIGGSQPIAWTAKVDVLETEAYLV